MTSKDYVIRAADWSQSQHEIMSVRERVFVVEQGVPAALERDGADETAAHWLALDARGAAVGTARLLPDGRIGRMAVLKPFRGRGVGGALLAAVLAEARRRGLDEVWLTAQRRAVSFYIERGFRAEGEVYFEAGLPHRRMRRWLIE